MVAAVNSPTYLVNRALARRRVIANNPTVLPAASASQPSPDQLYNFADVGGVQRANVPQPTQRPVSPLGQSIPGESPTSMPAAQSPGGLDMPDDTPAATRPRVVPNQPTRDVTPYPSQSPTGSDSESASPIEQELSNLMQQRAALENTQPVDDDTKLGNFWHGSQYAVRQVQREGGADVGATIGALIGGGLRGLFTKNEDEKRELADKIAITDKKIETTQKQYDRDLEIQAKKLSNKGKEITNNQDFLKTVTEHPIWQVAMKQKQITPDMAKTLNKTFGVNVPVGDWRDVQDRVQNGQVFTRKEFDPNYSPNSSVPVDPTKVPVQTNSPVTGTPVSVEPGQLLSNETAIAQGNAQRAQSAETTNVNNVKDIAIKNAELMNGWQNANLKLRMDAVKALGDQTSGMGELQGVYTQMQSIYNQMDAAQQKINSAEDDDAREKAQKEFDKLQGEFGKAQGTFDEKLGKVQGGGAALQQIQQMSVPKPSLLSAPSKVNAQTVGGKYAGQMFTSPDTLKTYFPGKSINEIRQIVEGQGGKFQK